MPVEISSYIKKLPICEINGKRYRFINGVGFGIDGYCCEMGDEFKKKSKRKVKSRGKSPRDKFINLILPELVAVKRCISSAL